MDNYTDDLYSRSASRRLKEAEVFNTGHENLPLKLEDAVSWRDLWERIKVRIWKWLEGRIL